MVHGGFVWQMNACCNINRDNIEWIGQKRVGFLVENLKFYCFKMCCDTL